MPQALVIDDEKSILSIIESILTCLGYDVSIAHNGQEGIEIFEREHNLDLVITDIRMPGTDGNGVAEHIRSSNRPETPIVGVSGFANEVDTKLFDFLLPKPFRIQTLADVIQTIEEDRR